MLGASNLTRGIGTAVEAARRVLGGPLDVMAAMGHGRSYGQTSRVMVRTLPGIDDCLLWEDLARRDKLPTAALLTDIGNDIGYGAPVDMIAGWVRRAVDRLLECESKVVITLLPLENLERLSPLVYLFFRTMFFPNNRATLDDIRRQAQQLNAELESLGRDRDIVLCPPAIDWYVLDPIHIRRKYYGHYWTKLLSHWVEEPPSEPASPSLSRFVYLRRLPPAQRWICGRPQQAQQPAGRLDDGTTISWY